MNRKYQNHATGLPATARVSCQLVAADGSLQEKEEEIVIEKELEVSVNGVPAFRLTCTPKHLTELVLGRLCTERIIRSEDEVAHLFICGEGNIAEVRLRENVDFQPYSGAEPTCCTGNRQLVERVDTTAAPEAPETAAPEASATAAPEVPETAAPEAPEISAPEAPKTVSREPSPADVFLLTEKFREDGALHRNTGGTHSCYIRLGDGRILSFEDIGRHNALDKAVGAMLLEGMDPKDCMLYTTGRVAADMITKVINARIPVLISKAVPTDEAVRLARLHHVTLICRAWPDSYTLVN